MHGIWHAACIIILVVVFVSIVRSRGREASMLILSVCPGYHKRKPKLCVRCYKITRFLRIPFLHTQTNENSTYLLSWWTERQGVRRGLGRTGERTSRNGKPKPEAEVLDTKARGKAGGEALMLNPERVQWGTSFSSSSIHVTYTLCAADIASDTCPIISSWGIFRFMRNFWFLCGRSVGGDTFGQFSKFGTVASDSMTIYVYMYVYVWLQCGLLWWRL